MEANEIIREIQKEKKEKNIVPDGALWSEIINRASAELKKELNTLVKEKKIRFNKTLNDLMFYSNED
jgi:hypothetical protein